MRERERERQTERKGMSGWMAEGGRKREIVTAYQLFCMPKPK